MRLCHKERKANLHAERQRIPRRNILLFSVKICVICGKKNDTQNQRHSITLDKIW